ncbi:MAG: hypothetical protein QN189_08305 [Armatimonadota bacterium]|nr:hypothetical protein [Armatimonadota bacterium]
MGRPLAAFLTILLGGAILFPSSPDKISETLPGSIALGAPPGAPSDHWRIPFRIVLIQEASRGALHIREILTLAPADGTPGEQETVLFPLPQRARKVSVVRGGQTVMLMEKEMVIYRISTTSYPIETVLDYEVPYRWRTAILQFPVQYPTGSFDLFVPSGFRVKSPQLARKSPRIIRGQWIERYTAEKLRPGPPVVVSLSGLPLPTRDLAIRGGILLMALAVMIILAAPWLGEMRKELLKR